MLAPSKCLATLPISVIILGSMLSAPVLVDLMQRRGRRTGFVLGAVGGGVGSALCAVALVKGSFGLFLAGSLLSGLYMSAQAFYRFAATDGASEDVAGEGDLLRDGRGARVGGRSGRSWCG